MPEVEIQETQVPEEIVEETPGEETTIVEETPVELSTDDEGQVGNFEDPDYGDIVGMGEETPPAEETPVVETPLETPEQTPELTPTVELEAVVEPVAVVESTTPTPESVPEVTPVAEQTPVETPMSDEQYQTAVAKHMTDSIDKLSGLYGLSEEEAAKIDDLDAKPSEWLPKMMAQLHYNVFMSQRADIQSTLPNAVGEITNQNMAYAKAETTFFEQFPSLSEHKDVATNAAAQIRQTNPNLQGAELTTAVGNLAMASLGLNPAAAIPAPTPEVVPIVPPAPAGIGQVGAPVSTEQPNSYEEGIFASMVEEELNNQ